ncbi:MAG TPA: hypothetical protein VGC37_06290 [Friedmanniella sp.]
MTSLTLITVVVVLYGLLNKHGFGRALALGGATAAGSAAYVGGVAIPTFYAVAILAAGLVVARTCLPRSTPRSPRAGVDGGILLLVCFLFWSVLVTLVAPFLFPGAPTVNPVKGVLVPGQLTSSNLAQIIYLFLGLAVVQFIRRSRGGGAELIGIAAGTCTALSAWRYLSQVAGLPFPEGLFDNSPSFAYIETAAGGLQRFRGVLSEPAGLASNCLVTIFYMVSRARQVRGWRRACCLVLAAVGLYLGTISTSTTFFIAGLTALGVVLVVIALWFLARRVAFARSMVFFGALAVVVLVWVLPLLYSFVASAVNDKLASSSYTDRSSANEDALASFFNSFGLGVGLGSVRASSFVPTLLGATGVVGALLFTAAVVVFVRRSASSPSRRPIVWALVTFLIVKVAAGPDLSDSSGVLWLALGLLSRPLDDTEDLPRPVVDATGAAPPALTRNEQLPRHELINP